MERTKRNRPSFLERDGPNTMCAEQSIVFKVSGVSQTVRWAARRACWRSHRPHSHNFCRISLATSFTTNRDSLNTMTELIVPESDEYSAYDVCNCRQIFAEFVDYIIIRSLVSLLLMWRLTTNNKSKDVNFFHLSFSWKMVGLAGKSCSKM